MADSRRGVASPAGGPPIVPAAAAVAVAARVLIRASPERVWAVLTDFPAMRRWFLGVRAVRLDGNAGVGTRRVVTFAGGFAQRETVSAWTPPVHLGLVVDEPSGMIAAGTCVDIRLAGSEDGVRLTWSIAVRLNLGGLAAVLSGPFTRLLVGAALRASLGRLRRLSESPP